MEVYRWTSLDSTNIRAKALITSGHRSPALLVTETQSLGKGQQGRSFSSPQGGLYCTFLDSTDLAPSWLPCVTLAVGVACAEVLEELGKMDVQLKWPNDLYLNGHKLGGILCESMRPPDQSLWLLIGIGLNLNNRISQYPRAIRSRVTTLYEETGRTVDIHFVLSQLGERLYKKRTLLVHDRKKLLAQWQKRDYLYGEWVQYDDGKSRRVARGKGMVDDGRYCIQFPDGKQIKVLSGRLLPHG
ncbi:MAG: biotin--[acetyl-CoA-carboxylase] ligase [Desulfobulbus propionicus]|nr:MAG: biotin--[acetyl-CoA-carboxylase] ligase [Desulfobulbus propionicus]